MTENNQINSKKTHAYTPGLKVKDATYVNKIRRLPILGEVLCNLGTLVDSNTIVARSEISGNPEIVKVSLILSIDPGDTSKYMNKKEGDYVKKGEILGQYSFFFGFIKREVLCPIDGIIESISNSTGQVVIRGKPIPIEVESYIPGKILKILPNEGVLIGTNAAFIQGIFGIGGEAHGKIKIIVDSPDEEVTVNHIKSEYKGLVLIGGSLITLDAINKCVEVGVSSIIVGGIHHNDLVSFLNEEIGVAITGEEVVGITLIVTEGFGKMTMSKHTFNLLKQFENYQASTNGTTQIRAGVIRPEIIIPHENKIASSSDEESNTGMLPGTTVRIIRQPYFGIIGKVYTLPKELHRLKSGSKVRVLEVELENNEIVTVPRANVEIIEE